MSSVLSADALEFYTNYAERHTDFSAAARLASTFVSDRLTEAGLSPHAVSGRAKDPDSLLEKLRRKHYSNPRDEVTDLIGVRVVTMYRDEVDLCADALTARLHIDLARSVDKRRQLDLREFGYRSVHLIVSLGDLGVEAPDDLHDFRFEVQIRSLLEHAWAENEHEIFYKSGVSVSAESSRAFAAVAGTLELLDREFERLRGVLDTEVALRRQGIDDGSGSALPLDTAAVIALLQCLAPDNPGWLLPGNLPRRSAALVLEALRVAGLTTVTAVKLAFQSEKFRNAVSAFASLSGMGSEEVSHLAIGALLAGTQDDFPLAEFPDLLSDPRLMAALEAVS